MTPINQQVPLHDAHCDGSYIPAMLVKTDKACCADLTTAVMQAVKSSRLPVPVQVSTVFIHAEDLTEEDLF